MLSAITSLNPIRLVIALFSVFSQPSKSSPRKKNLEDEAVAEKEFTIYRQAELNRTTASLLANGAILIVGEEGSGKSVLGNAVVEKLTDDGFLVAFVEPTRHHRAKTGKLYAKAETIAGQRFQNKNKLVS